MSHDETESVRRQMLENGQPAHDASLAQPLLDTQQMSELYEVIGFMAPFCVVRRKSDGKKGSLEFTHNPRHYFNFVED